MQDQAPVCRELLPFGFGGASRRAQPGCELLTFEREERRAKVGWKAWVFPGSGILWGWLHVEKPILKCGEGGRSPARDCLYNFSPSMFMVIGTSFSVLTMQMNVPLYSYTFSGGGGFHPFPIRNMSIKYGARLT